MGLIPPFFFDCVVAIGSEDSDKKQNWIASGFLYGYHSPTPEQNNLYKIFLVTNRHVFSDLRTAILRFNPQQPNEPARIYAINLLDENEKPRWYSHTDAEIDIAVIPINYEKLKNEGMQCTCFQSNVHVADIQKLNDLGIIEGDFAYVLGFPLGLVGENRNNVIARSGTIARVRDTLSRNNKEFLLDSFVFPGNSGGPVVSKPEAMAITGTKAQDASYLIGVVKSYVPYNDVAISLQTKRPRVIFEENSGLAAAHPIDYVQDIIGKLLAKEENKNK